ncbi:unnamed protein product [Cylindrotheca closterium]|uniref:Uncharacterized protein n=1 Tax=Cylindrotheca closterium TaxID=2856 RepID=A0AAD2CQ11_9STRA|nr:unnamed protein product [Cylindrotheca closterium]
MGKSKGKNGKKQNNSKKKKANTTAAASVAASEGGLMVDPARVRFQHSKIRPVFSGCGRSVEGTLEQIRDGRLNPSDLPPIQVIVGPPVSEDDDGPWYFSLNNRRLWVLKRCREEGLLPNNQIFVRVRKPKSEQEAQRYCLENCALEAKIIAEKSRGPSNPTNHDNEDGNNSNDKEAEESAVEVPQNIDTKAVENGGSVPEGEEKVDTDDSDDESSSDDDSVGVVSNRFSALF